jgi:Domain of unknown function (DUF4332)
MGYSIDFNALSLDQYKSALVKKTFIPSRQLLKDKADIHFKEFKNANIRNLDELFTILKSDTKKAELLKNKNISDDYLTILLRELKSIQPKPLPLKDFSWVSVSSINKLEHAGIVNSKQLYEKCSSRSARKKVVSDLSVDENDVTELLKLSDLTRIQWVNTTFARILFAAGFDTVKKVASAFPDSLYEKVCTKNEMLKLYKGKIGLNDMKLCVEAAMGIDSDIEV